MSIFNLFGKSKGKPRPELGSPFDLNKKILQLSPSDFITIGQTVENFFICGGIGSGKSSGSGAALARAMLSANYGFLVLTAKPDERATWERYAAETGRSEDLVIFSPQNEWRFNFMDYELRRGGTGAGLTENIVNLFLAIVEIGERGKSGGGMEQFWKDTLRQLLRSTIDLLSIAKGSLSLNDIYQVIMSAPKTPAYVRSKEWQDTSFCAKMLLEGRKKQKTPMELNDFNITKNYFLTDFAGLNDKTKSSILMNFTSIADPFLRGVLRELFCTTTNIVPEITWKSGAIIVLDLPVKQYNQLGTFSQVMFKYIFQRAIERRDVTKEPRPVALWSDEAQLFALPTHDREFASTCRSSRVASVMLSQNLTGFYSAFGGESGKYEVDSLIGNYVHKIFHANSCNISNNFAADLCGKSYQMRGGFGMTTGDEGQTTSSSSGNESLEHNIIPSDFMTLRTGGAQNDLCVDAIICRSGNPWNGTGKSYLQTTFKQQ